MRVQKLTSEPGKLVPIIAALPYSIIADEYEGSAMPVYDPITQRTKNAGSGYSTSRYDESAGGLFQSKSDTKKDD